MELILMVVAFSVGTTFLYAKSFKKTLLITVCALFALSGCTLAIWKNGVPISIYSVLTLFVAMGFSAYNGAIMVSNVGNSYQMGLSFKESVKEGALSSISTIIFNYVFLLIPLIPLGMFGFFQKDVLTNMLAVFFEGTGFAVIMTLVFFPSFIMFFHKTSKEGLL